MDDYQSRPTTEQLRAELARLTRKKSGSVFGKLLLIFLLLILIAAAVGIILLPGFVIYGNSMAPSLEEGDIVISWPYAEIDNGDLVAFRYGERVLVKRVVASSGDKVEVLPDGSVLRNGFTLYEPYATLNDGQEQTDLEYPITVPEGSYFVLGDNRIVSKDSRYRSIGMIPRSRIVGKASLRVWPFKNIGFIE